MKTIKMQIPDDLYIKACDAFSYRQKDFDEKNVTKEEWFLYMIGRHVKEVTSDYIVNIETFEQVEALKENIRTEKQAEIEQIKVEVDDDAKR